MIVYLVLRAAIIPVCAGELVIIQTSTAKPYQDFVGYLAEAMPGQSLTVLNIDNDIEKGEQMLHQLKQRVKPDLVIALGAKATWLMRNEPSMTVMFSMLSDPDRYPIDHLPGVTLESPPSQYLNKIRQILPNLRRIGVLYSDPNHTHIDEIGRLASSLKFELVAERVDTHSDVSAKVHALFKQVDLIWLLSDPVVTASPRLVKEAILLPAAQRRIPVVGFNRWSVSNGALFCLANEYQQIAEQSALMAKRILNGETLSLHQAPLNPQTHLNPKVSERLSRDIDVNIPEDAFVIR